MDAAAQGADKASSKQPAVPGEEDSAEQDKEVHTGKETD